MRTDIPIDSENLFELRQREKDAQSEKLFGQHMSDSNEFQAYVEQQVFEKPKRLKIGKPAFAPKF